MPSQHALLSPSAAHRWLHCFPSARLEHEQPDGGSDFAREGTLAHAYGARHLKVYAGLPTKAEDAEIAELHGRYFAPEMLDFVEMYTGAVIERLCQVQRHTPDARLIVEQRLCLEPYLPGGFGTADAIIVADDTLDVFDLKFGKGVRVSAKDNAQMRIYALGALQLYDTEFTIRRVRMTIVQPRLDHVSAEELSVDELTAWGDDFLRPRALLAAEGMGDLVAGSWCRFCRVQGQCSAVAAMAQEATAVKDFQLLTAADLAGRILPKLDAIEAWVSAVREYCRGLALSGQPLPGYKLVEGRSKRTITDPERAVELLRQAGLQPEQYLKAPELQSLSALEKLVGRKAFAELLAPVLSRPPGKPTLVADDDPRAPFDPFVGLEADIN